MKTSGGLAREYDRLDGVCQLAWKAGKQAEQAWSLLFGSQFHEAPERRRRRKPWVNAALVQEENEYRLL